MKQIKTIVLFISAVIIFSNCAQLSSFTTAKSVGKNNAEIGFAASGAGFTDFINNVDDETAVLPVFEFWGRYGVGEKMDLGLKLSTGLSGVFDLKYQFLGDRQSMFAMALGGGLGFQGGTLDALLLQGHIPLFISVHPTDKFAIYTNPRFISQFIPGEGSLNYGGASFGLEFGSRVKLNIEGNYFKILGDLDDVGSAFDEFGVGLYQIGLGLKFLIGKN